MAFSPEQEVKILICIIVLYNILYTTTISLRTRHRSPFEQRKGTPKMKLHVYVIELLNSASTKCYMYVYLLTV